MIVAERSGRFVLTTNDDHARMAGQLAGMLSKAVLPEKQRRKEFVYAVAEHDRSWIELDTAPIWNERAEKPFSITDYPLVIRLPHYLRGLDEVAKMSPYAGLLCSMHYTTLPPDALKGAAGGANSQLFSVIKAVKQREMETIGQLKLHGDEEMRLLEKHFKLLQMLDRLSLWLCTRCFGDDPADAADPYRLMFGSVEEGFRHDGIELRWSARKAVRVKPFLWNGPVMLTWKRKEIPASLAREIGLTRAWQESPFRRTRIQLLPEEDE
ncbi:Protein of unknown function [Paenibacillus sp. UNCCL117]|uniref:DUF3891 family protein n=1 Tax=unclassified Paenibacillus TaxID=185978 RepID=UPI0008914EA3|nr:MULTISPECIES: DUF3891 family protein [unclassified Paenibacillus]SDD64230.1 Protein of unknown function [Paenibacillus sp. cl123]SFW58364.1 Protein of unknown function [Paenibacillus sp. UNCCL117]